MALSGSMYTNVGSGFRLQLEWSGSQSVSNNTTTITAKLYWMSLSSGYTVSSSATKTCSVTIGGSSDTTSGSSMASLSGGQKKLIGSYSRTITHDSDGTASVSFDGWFDAEVTLSGTYYGRINLTSKTYDLNTIPRASTLTNDSISFTAGSSLSFGIKRASSSFSHTLEIRVNNVLIDTLTGVGTSVTWTPSSTEEENIYKELAKDTTNFNQTIEVTLVTKNGSSTVGEKTYTGTVTAQKSSYASSSASFNIGSEVSVSITRYDSAFTHTVRFYVNNSLIKTITGVTTSTKWTPTSTEITNMYSKTPAKTGTSKIEVDTYFGNTKVRSTYSKTGTATVTNSTPTFTSSGVTYADQNSTTKTVTGDSQIIVQDVSTVRVTIPLASRATPKNGATMVKYNATLNGVTKSGNYSTTGDVNIDFGTVSANTDLTLTVKAVDSRGFETPVTKTVKVLAYTKPTINGTAKRASGFENSTRLSLNGAVSSLLVGGVQKNTTKAVRYRYRKATEAETVASWVTLNSFTISKPTATSYLATAIDLDLDNTVSWKVDFIAEDNLSATVLSLVVASGKPILFIDANKKSVGVGKFPTLGDGGLDVEGTVKARTVEFVNNSYANSSGGPAMKLNNSDIVGINQTFRSDSATTDAEGDNWAKSTTPAGSVTNVDYDTFRIFDGTGYLNSRPIFTSDDEILWEGAFHVNATQTITPSKPITKCPNGWVLVWSYYDGSSADNSNWNYTFVHKRHAGYTNGGFWASSLNMGTSTTVPLRGDKYLYATETQLKGHSRNNTGNEAKFVLRYIISF